MLTKLPQRSRIKIMVARGCSEQECWGGLQEARGNEGFARVRTLRWIINVHKSYLGCAGAACKPMLDVARRRVTRQLTGCWINPIHNLSPHSGQNRIQKTAISWLQDDFCRTQSSTRTSVLTSTWENTTTTGMLAYVISLVLSKPEYGQMSPNCNGVRKSNVIHVLHIRRNLWPKWWWLWWYRQCQSPHVLPSGNTLSAEYCRLQWETETSYIILRWIHVSSISVQMRRKASVFAM